MPRHLNLRDTPIWLRILFAVAFLNFLTFATVAHFHGGDAINGKVENGKYYVGNHGRYTQVSPAFFNYSRLHAFSVFATHGLAILGGFSLVFAKRN